MIWLAISMMGATQIKILGPKENINAEVYVVCYIQYKLILGAIDGNNNLIIYN